jgi:hypothetical protein
MKLKPDERRALHYRDFFVHPETRESQERLTPAARQLTRKRLKAKANLRWGDEFAEGSTDNMSLKGAYIRTSTAIPVMETILIELSPPDKSHPSISVVAQVVRRDENGIGVEFKNLSLETHANLQAFVVSLGGQ